MERKKINNIACGILIACLLLTSVSAFSQRKNVPEIMMEPEDVEIVNRFLTEMNGKRSLPVDQLIIETAKFFLGTPYVASTLEQRGPERLVINLRELDCTTFVENVFALTRTLKSEVPSFNAYCENLRMLRYREGEIRDYTDRLHYTSDWIWTNERKQLLKDVSKEIGGELWPLKVNFMSTHPDSYSPLKGQAERIATMDRIEKEISARSYYFIPEAKINELGKGMKNGDIVGFVTAIEGLDVSHVGIVYHQDGKLTFIHASSKAKEVIINEAPMFDYVAANKNGTGVVIVRYEE